MKIWIVMIGSHEDKYACAAFSSEEKANEFVASFNARRGTRDDMWVFDHAVELDSESPRFLGT